MPEEKLTTRKRIIKIIEGMEEAGSILTISGVAKEVGIHHSTIHNRYQDLAERIQTSAGVAIQKDAKQKLTKRLGTIKDEKTKRSRLLEKLKQFQELLRKVNSVNATLAFENVSLKARLDGELHKHRARIVDIRDTVSKSLD